VPQHASPVTQSQIPSSSATSSQGKAVVVDCTAPGVVASELTQSTSRSSPELDTAEMNGEYVDRTSGLSFLQRARSRLKSRGGPSADQAERSRQPLTAAGDKPLLDVLSVGESRHFTSYS
jgi:hypothetical protein